jgi:hypothetical protein
LVNFSCGTSSKNESSNVKYFRHLQFSETSYDQMKGTHPLTAKEAETINHYRFTCNDKGQLTEVAYMRGNTLLSYSSMGAAKIEITYTDSTETQHFFNKDGQVADQEGVYANVYKLDKNGNRIGLSFLDKSGNKMVDRNNISYFVYKILPDGMVQEKRYDAKNEETIRNKFCPFYELRFSYDDKGHCVRLANYQADTLYSCTAENCGDIGVSYFLMKTNEAGDLDSFAVFNASGVPSNLYWGWSRFINKHDENGNLVRSDFFDQDGEPLGGKSNPITTYTYDEHGAVTEVKYFDKDMKPFASARAGGAAMLKYTYNASGQPLDTLRFNVALEPIKKD